LDFLVCRGFGDFNGVLVLVEFSEGSCVLAEDAGGKEAIVGGKDQVAGRDQVAHGDEAWLGLGVVAAEEIEPVQFIGRDQALDLVENGEGSKGLRRGSRPWAVSQTAWRSASPDCAPRDWPMSAETPLVLPKGTSFLTSAPMAPAMRTMISKSGLTPARSAAFFDQLDVAVGVGDGAGFFVEAGGGQDYVGEGGGFGEEDVLDDDEGVLERCGVCAVGFDGIGADDVERAEGALRCGIEHLRSVEAGLGWEIRILFGEDSGRGYGNVAGEQVGVEAHVGRAAGVGVIAQGRRISRFSLPRPHLTRFSTASPRYSSPKTTSRDSSASRASRKDLASVVASRALSLPVRNSVKAS
jgi:hypothetical protein